MLLKNTVYVWNSTPLLVSDPSLVPMIYTSPNADGSFSGYNTTTSAKVLNQSAVGHRVLIFQAMLSPLFSTPNPPFYDLGISVCQPKVNQFFQTLHGLGVTHLDAVIPDVEGALCDWQITPQVAEVILGHPEAPAFLNAIGYTGLPNGSDLSTFVQTHRQQVEPVLASYADQAIVQAIKPLTDLYGDVLIQKGSLSCPAYAASLLPQPWDAGDTPVSPMQCSFAQCDEVYGACQANYAWSPVKIAETWLARLAVAKGSSRLPLVPWIAPKSYAGTTAFPVRWANSLAYDGFMQAAMKLSDSVLYWRPPTATESDDVAVVTAMRSARGE